jgi:hypothetical protein
MARTPNGRAGKPPDIGQQTPCHSEKANEMMVFGTSEDAFQSAIGAAGGRFFHLTSARIAGKAGAC